MSEGFDLVIVGAGPAGMAAAITARELELRTLVLDEQNAPGGQIYRSLELVAEQHPERLKILGDDYAAGLELLRAFRACGCDYRPGASVWQIEPPGTVLFSTAGRSQQVIAKRVVIATGAMERAMPLSGWTLPGVMSAGAAQILLKSAGALPQGRVVLIGSGPLLLLFAWQLQQAGVRIQALVDTGAGGVMLRAARHLPRALFSPGYLRKGLRLLRALGEAGVRVLSAAEHIQLRGDERVREVVLTRNGSVQTIAADVVLLHQGVVPNANLGWALRCEHDWVDRQRCFVPRTDRWGSSSNEAVQFAGDCAGIAGARAAEYAGHVAALEAGHRLGRIDRGRRDGMARAHFADLERHRRIRPLLETLYYPSDRFVVPDSDDVLVCRCEEITAGEIRRIVAQGCPGPNQMKAFARCGMGPCQGRLCGLTVTELIARSRGRSPAQIGYYRIRPPIKPLSLRDLSELEL